MTDPKKKTQAPDIKPGMTREEWEKNCEYYAEDAFYTPPDKFLFRHYDEPESQRLVCWRPMVGIEKYQVSGVHGGFYGLYETRDVSYYIKSGTWIVIDDPEFFRQAEIAELEAKLAALKNA